MFWTTRRWQEPLETYKSFLKNSSPLWYLNCRESVPDCCGYEEDAREGSNCARMAWAKASVFKSSCMVSITWESMGMLKTCVAWSRAGPKITCFWLSKVGSPGRGARYERRDKVIY